MYNCSLTIPTIVDKIILLTINTGAAQSCFNYMDLNKDNFEQEVLKSEQTVVVDFWAPWCGPCKILSPIVEEIANEYAGKLKVHKINVDENNEIAMNYGIMSIPTLKIFKSGKVAGEIVGAAPKQMIMAQLDPIIA